MADVEQPAKPDSEDDTSIESHSVERDSEFGAHHPDAEFDASQWKCAKFWQGHSLCLMMLFALVFTPLLVGFAFTINAYFTHQEFEMPVVMWFLVLPVAGLMAGACVLPCICQGRANEAQPVLCCIRPFYRNRTISQCMRCSCHVRRTTHARWIMGYHSHLLFFSWTCLLIAIGLYMALVVVESCVL